MMELDDGVLIITDSISVNAAVVVWAVHHFSTGLKDLQIITQASLLEGNLNFKPSSLSAIISISEKPGFNTQLWLSELAKVIKPGGCVFIQEPSFFRKNKDLVLAESRACLERNLLYSGFFTMEDFKCIDHSAGIDCASQEFGLIAIKATRTYDAEAFSSSQKAHIRNAKSFSVAVDSSLPSQVDDDMETFDDESSLLMAEVTKRAEVSQDESFLARERIRERNRLYQQRRRARMTEEQKKREKERRRQYMQNRRVHFVDNEMTDLQPVTSFDTEKECKESSCS